MNLARLEFYGFRSFKDRTVLVFQTEQTLTYITSLNLDAEHMDGNAAGKSTILEAICWALYGNTPLKLKVDSYVNETSDQAFVQLQFTNGVIVERWRKKNRESGLRFTLGGGEWVEKSISETQQELISNVCGVSFEVFCNTIYLTGHSQVVKFLEATPTKRAPVLAEMEDHSVWSEAGKLADKEKKEVVTQLKMLEVENKKDEQLRVRLNEELGAIREEFQKRQEEDAAIKAERARKILEIRMAITQHQKFIDSPSPFNGTELDKQITATQTRVRRLKEQQIEAQYTAKIAHLRPGLPCPTCKREMSEVDTAELDEKRDRARASLVQIEEYLASANSDMKRLNDQAAALAASQRQRALAQKEIEGLNEQLLILQDMDNPVNLKYYRDKEAKLRREHQELEAKYSHNALAEADLHEKAERLEKWKRAFTKEIKDLLFDRIRVGLSHHANNLFRPLFGARYHIDCPPCESDEFRISIMRDGVEREYLAYSGGEKYRFQMGLFLAFGKILDASRKCPFKFRLLDEFGEGLDPAGKEAIRELLFDFADSGEVDYFLVTVPSQELAEGYPQIKIIMENKESRLV